MFRTQTCWGLVTTLGLAVTLGGCAYEKERDKIVMVAESAIPGFGDFVRALADRVRESADARDALEKLQKLAHGIDVAGKSAGSASAVDQSLIGILNELVAILEYSNGENPVVPSGSAPTGSGNLGRLIWEYPRLAGQMGAGNPGAGESETLATELANQINSMSRGERLDLAAGIREFVNSLHE